jgi:hypothetical protein
LLVAAFAFFVVTLGAFFLVDGGALGGGAFAGGQAAAIRIDREVEGGDFGRGGFGANGGLGQGGQEKELKHG